MPGPERAARSREQQLRLAGVRIEGSLQPSHALLDLIWQMRDDDVLRFVAPEICTSRTQESCGIKKEQFVKTDPSGKLQAVSRDEQQHADMTTEYRIKLSLTRRALAFDNIGLCSFAVLEDYHDYLYALVMREPISTHYPISVQQILVADKHLWSVMIELTRDGIVVDSSGRKPIEDKLKLARQDPIFCSLLQPLPRPQSGHAYDKDPLLTHRQARAKVARESERAIKEASRVLVVRAANLPSRLVKAANITNLAFLKNSRT